MRMGIMLLCAGLAGCAHRSGPDDLKGQPLMVCRSHEPGYLQPCELTGEPYRRAMKVARADFAQWLEALPKGPPTWRPELDSCIRQPSNYGWFVGIRDEDIQVFFYPVNNCLAPGEVGTGLGMTYTIRRGDMKILAREPHE
jgi:hypothetical protein